MEHTNTTMMEDTNSNLNPPAITTVHESSPVTQNNSTTNNAGVADIIHECEWYNYNNVDYIPLNGKVPKKKWGIRLHSGEVLYQNSDIRHMFSPLDNFLMSFPNDVTELHKLFRIIILITIFETISRARLRSTVSQNE